MAMSPIAPGLLTLLIGLWILTNSSAQEAQVDVATGDQAQSVCKNDLPCETVGETDTVSFVTETLEDINAGSPIKEESLVASKEVSKAIEFESAGHPDDKSGEEKLLQEPLQSEGLDDSQLEPVATKVGKSDSLDAQESDSDVEGNAESPHLQVIGLQKKPPAATADSHNPGLDSEPQPSTSTKRKLFPFLYTSLFSTFKSLLRSFLSEFVEESSNQEVTANASEYSNQSFLAAEEESVKDLNTTANGTDSVKKTRFQCFIKNVTGEDVGKVKVVNSTELLDILSLSKTQKLSNCVLVMFYAPWCHFCAHTAPHFNALARAFPQLDVLAVDTSHFSYLNARFGTVAVPNIMLFHSRSAVRFNHTKRALDKFTQFVTNNTGLEPRKFVLLEPLDFVGPLPCVVRRGRDWLLWLAWVFVATCTACGFVQSQYGQGFIARLKVLWQEHQHID